MLAIVLGCIIGGIMIFSSDKAKTKYKENILLVAGIAIILLFVIFSVCVPTKYGEKQFDGIVQIEISQIYNEIDSDNLIFVNNSTYEYKGDINVYIVSTIMEDPNCEIPELRRYVQKPKISIWTLGFLGEKKEEYILCVPGGAIKREILK